MKTIRAKAEMKLGIGINVGSQVWYEGKKYDVEELGAERGIKIARLREVGGHGSEWFEVSSLQLAERKNTPMQWISEVDGKPTRTLEEFAFFAGPNAEFVVRACKNHEAHEQLVADIRFIENCMDKAHKPIELLAMVSQALEKFERTIARAEVQQ